MDIDMDTTTAMRDIQIEDAFSSSGEDITMTDIESITSKISLSSTIQDQHNSRLLNLPAELRQRIWFYCLHNHNQPITWPSRTKCGDRLALGLLRTCKLVNSEASPYLYENTIMCFKHPSDTNVFPYVHNVELGKRMRRMLLHVLDQDLELWIPYFKSGDIVRSMTHDYPHLTELRIVLCSTAALRHTAQDVRMAYRRWVQSQSLQSLCNSLRLMAEKGVDVKIIFFRAASPDEQVDLFETFPDDFTKFPPDAEGPRLRTEWIKSSGTLAALDATPRENPWFTGNFF